MECKEWLDEQDDTKMKPLCPTKLTNGLWRETNQLSFKIYVIVYMLYICIQRNLN